MQSLSTDTAVIVGALRKSTSGLVEVCQLELTTHCVLLP